MREKIRTTFEILKAPSVFLLVAALVIGMGWVPRNGAVVNAQFPGSYNSCDQSKTTTTLLGATSGTSATQLVALAVNTPIYVCRVLVTGVSGTNPTFSLVYGTGTNCATGQTLFLPVAATVAQTPVVYPGPYLGAVPAGKALCYLDGGTAPVQNYIIVYAQG